MKRSIVRSADLQTLEIVETEENVVPQNYVCACPNEIGSGDMAFLSLEGKGKIRVDWQALRESRAKADEKSWNDMSVVERFKSEWFKG